MDVTNSLVALVIVGLETFIEVILFVECVLVIELVGIVK